eukprot:TRINITY_DN370_c0_g1_i1.p1 TRINITY_DN370_c0_g1~~TRINITY_DN370_c0_g1_i1.p1  ORF type:complete len:529 (-),score=108.98 TRINITY_DN370_c0_g1_i1:103-1587(-)
MAALHPAGEDGKQQQSVNRIVHVRRSESVDEWMILRIDGTSDDSLPSHIAARCPTSSPLNLPFQCLWENCRALVVRLQHVQLVKRTGGNQHEEFHSRSRPAAAALPLPLPRHSLSQSRDQRQRPETFSFPLLPNLGHLLKNLESLRGEISSSFPPLTPSKPFRPPHLPNIFLRLPRFFSPPPFFLDVIAFRLHKVLNPRENHSCLLPFASLSSIVSHSSLPFSEKINACEGETRGCVLFHDSKQDGLPEELAHVSRGQERFTIAMSTEAVARRLDGVEVYTVSNAANEFVLVSDMDSQKSLGLFCFRQEDAEALLAQVKDKEPSLGRGARVVAVTLDKVYQLSAEGIAFRFLPDPLQVKHALEARAKAGDSSRAFDGIPVFQSENLILKSKSRRFCPIFFTKEDLEVALKKAMRQQQRVNPAMKVSSNVQVGSLEDVLKKMESNEEDSGWGDIVFIPPGMDADSHLGRAVASTGSRISSSSSSSSSSKGLTVFA